jgi:hypothetical protein
LKGSTNDLKGGTDSSLNHSLNNSLTHSVLPNRRTTNSNIWIGTKDTVTEMHYDSYDNFFIQVAGVKRVKLHRPALSLISKKVGSGDNGDNSSANAGYWIANVDFLADEDGGEGYRFGKKSEDSEKGEGREAGKEGTELALKSEAAKVRNEANRKRAEKEKKNSQHTNADLTTSEHTISDEFRDGFDQPDSFNDPDSFNAELINDQAYAQNNFSNLKVFGADSDVEMTYDFLVYPGDILYIPSFWWHALKAETPSTSLNYWLEEQRE